MNKETLTFELLKTLNQGSNGYIDQRVKYAMEQAEKLSEQIDISKIHTEKTSRITHEDYL